METKNSCEEGSCGKGMCGGSCGGCGHHHHHALKLLVKVIAFIFIVCFALKMGEVKGLVEASRMYHYNDLRSGMMYRYNQENTQPQPTTGGTNTTPPATTTK